MARAWSDQLDIRRRQPAAWSFIAKTVEAYVEASGEVIGWSLPIAPLTVALTYSLDTSATELAKTLGRAAAMLPIEEACYQLSACYTAMLPQEVRTAWGAYYTPPALTDRLLQLAKEAGVDWQTARILDPACGGGAFLLPVAMRMRSALPQASATELIEHFGAHLQGFEIDPFAAWLTQAWLEIAFADELKATGRRFPSVVKVCDSLTETVSGKRFDLVVGNPPYGRIKLAARQREHYGRSLYGHANLYGLFTDLALRWTRVGGVIAYVTPTGFLAGEYFKALRGLLSKEAPPRAVDFVTARKGVFEDVLQETMLATYKRGAKVAPTVVHYLSVNGTAQVTHAGGFSLPSERTDPWLAPRNPSDEGLVKSLERMPTRLSDWGYKVSTGPMVWNRFKGQFRNRPGKDTLPVIWAEAVTFDGRFIFRADKRNHEPHFRPSAGDEWLKVSEPCVLLQRTTAKEQARRLIAAELPADFIKTHGSVIVENHLNMVKPRVKSPKVSTAVIAAVLNSGIVDRVFRCISGSVAVSAFELEALPLPSPDELAELTKMVYRQARQPEIDAHIEMLYLSRSAA
ncbi:class I SAM-dependent DNA methyltransferase [Mesorhizobium sp. B4-1-4]|uniref:HsdM family class I SAM-dependent methyltransferase n=1 Tax=Mesorhizobium sp. B4-1-4 TaxID=2589888 RepID=UPI001D031B81|nr:N-6 DNA methylase [Mesorhizobium sp. B4-1-4]UCI32046.1 N-6 DNA methylase [Mesorhizobium sp. B4-1-4]